MWRASVSRVGKVKLGPYEEPLRRFLLFEIPFPDQCILTLNAFDLDDAETAGISLHNQCPNTQKGEGYHLHEFVVCGMIFRLFVGRLPPRYVKTLDIVRNSPPLIVINSPLSMTTQKTAIQYAASMISQKQKNGKLA